MELFNYLKLRKKHNMLNLKYEILEERIKNELYKKITKIIDNTENIERLEKINEKLKKENKALRKELIDAKFKRN